MELMYRFIFIIWDEAGRIHTAQASRLGYGSFADSLRSLGELAASVFIRAFKRADRIGLALESRGFEGNFEYLCERESSSPRLAALTALSASALTIVGTLERTLK
jgi:cobalt/nickel transport system permease protein